MPRLPVLPYVHIVERQLRARVNPWVLVDALQDPWKRLDAYVCERARKIPAPSVRGGNTNVDPTLGPRSMGELSTPATTPDAFRRGDAADEAAHAVALDTLVSRLKSRSIFFPYAFYSGGWGDFSILLDFARKLGNVSAWAVEPPSPVVTRLRPSVHGRDFASVYEGSFPTPVPSPALPPESLTAHFQLVIPTAWRPGAASKVASKDAVGSDAMQATAIEMLKARALVVLLPGTGEQGFMRRRHCISYPLARLGIASLILEGPYYGVRRPPAQRGSKLQYVTDLCVLGRTTIEEARALVQWANALSKAEFDATLERVACSLPDEQAEPESSSAQHDSRSTPSEAQTLHAAEQAVAAAEAHERPAAAEPDRTARAASERFFGCAVLAGTSMGGLHSAMTATGLRDPHLLPVGVASWLGPPSAAPVFALGALGAGVDWPALSAPLRDSATWTHVNAALEDMERALPPAQHDHVADVQSAYRVGFGGTTVNPARAGADPSSHRAAQAAAVWEAVAARAGELRRTLVATLDTVHGRTLARLPTPTLPTAKLQRLLQHVRTLIPLADQLRAPEYLMGIPESKSAARRQALRDDELLRSMLKVSQAIERFALDAKLPLLPRFSKGAIDHHDAERLEREAREFMARFMRVTDISNFLPPPRPQACIFTVASHDQYIPSTASVQTLWANVERTWRGAEIRRIRGGHVSASIFNLDTYTGTIVEVVRRLRSGEPKQG